MKLNIFFPADPVVRHCEGEILIGRHPELNQENDIDKKIIMRKLVIWFQSLLIFGHVRFTEKRGILTCLAEKSYYLSTLSSHVSSIHLCGVLLTRITENRCKSTDFYHINGDNCLQMLVCVSILPQSETIFKSWLFIYCNKLGHN